MDSAIPRTIRAFQPIQTRSTIPIGSVSHWFGVLSGEIHVWCSVPVRLVLGRRPMKRQSAIGFALLALGLGGSCLAAEGQKAVVIHAGQLFDGKSDRLVPNQVIVIQGD